MLAGQIGSLGEPLYDYGFPTGYPEGRRAWLNVRFFDAGFAEHSKDASQITSRPEGDALARYGNNMLPVDFYQMPAAPTKVFVYPYEKTKESLRGIARTAIDAHWGYKLRFVNPATGASPSVHGLSPTTGSTCEQKL